MPKELTQEYLKSILDYNPDTGIFVWKYRSDYPKWWNTRFSHKLAGHRTEGAYHLILIMNYPYLAHRLAWIYIHGVLPKNIDHIDGNGCNNKMENLREATASQNSMNRKGKKNSIYSKYKGVSFCKTRKKWVSQIKTNGKFISLGRFHTEEEAYKAYCLAAKKYFGEFAREA